MRALFSSISCWTRCWAAACWVSNCSISAVNADFLSLSSLYCCFFLALDRVAACLFLSTRCCDLHQKLTDYAIRSHSVQMSPILMNHNLKGLHATQSQLITKSGSLCAMDDAICCFQNGLRLNCRDEKMWSPDGWAGFKCPLLCAVWPLVSWALAHLISNTVLPAVIWASTH